MAINQLPTYWNTKTEKFSRDKHFLLKPFCSKKTFKSKLLWSHCVWIYANHKSFIIKVCFEYHFTSYYLPIPWKSNFHKLLLSSPILFVIFPFLCVRREKLFFKREPHFVYCWLIEVERTVRCSRTVRFFVMFGMFGVRFWAKKWCSEEFEVRS